MTTEHEHQGQPYGVPRRRFAAPGLETVKTAERPPAPEAEAGAEHYRRLYEQTSAELRAARAAIRDLEEAWGQSVERRLAIERALVRLLESTGKRSSPRALVARSRARAALRGVDPFDRR
jgi:hypothetical protein